MDTAKRICGCRNLQRRHVGEVRERYLVEIHDGFVEHSAAFDPGELVAGALLRANAPFRADERHVRLLGRCADGQQQTDPQPRAGAHDVVSARCRPRTRSHRYEIAHTARRVGHRTREYCRPMERGADEHTRKHDARRPVQPIVSRQFSVSVSDGLFTFFNGELWKKKTKKKQHIPNLKAYKYERGVVDHIRGSRSTNYPDAPMLSRRVIYSVLSPPMLLLLFILFYLTRKTRTNENFSLPFNINYYSCCVNRYIRRKLPARCYINLISVLPTGLTFSSSVRFVI